jgi:hypothetical protein
MSLEAVTLRTSATVYDRLGNETIEPFLAVDFPARDLRAAKLDNLPSTAALTFAEAYTPATSSAHDGLFVVCAAYVRGKPPICARVFAACETERRRTRSRVVPTCPEGGSFRVPNDVETRPSK